MLELIIGIIIGLVVGGLIIWLYLRSNLVRERVGRIAAETQLQENTKYSEQLKDTFNSLSFQALQNNNQAFLDLANQTLRTLLTEAQGDLTSREKSIEQLVKPLKESLDKYESQVREMERDRGKTYGELKNQLERLSKTEELLQKETDNLVRALKTPQVKGRWGEIALKRAVEIAGMTKYCDFEEQVSVDTPDGRLRPDLKITLPTNRLVVVDAKVPLTAYLEAVNASEETTRQNAFKRHSELVKNHMRSLCAKSYWSQFSPTPEFVILFMPGESFFSAALEQDRTLLEESAENRVILASPTTLIALLKAVAYGWKQQQMAENAQAIAETGKELFERFSKFIEYLIEIRQGIVTAAEAYNKAVGSFESRLVPGGRKLKELGAAAGDRNLPEIKPVDVYLRNPQPVEEKPRKELF